MKEQVKEVKEVKEVKAQDTHLIRVELSELEALIPMILKKNKLLQELEVSSISEFEEKLNEKTQWVNTVMSASALGYENQYKQLLSLENLIDGKLSANDLTQSSKLKQTIIQEITEKNTVYFTEDEIEVRAKLRKIRDAFNDLDFQARKHLLMDNRNQKLMNNPYLKL
jgi:hypothetical protein